MNTPTLNIPVVQNIRQSYTDLGDELVDASPSDIERGFVADWIANIPTLRFTVECNYGISGSDTKYLVKANDMPNDEWWASGAWRKLLVTSDTTIFNPASMFEDSSNYSAGMKLLPTTPITGENPTEYIADGLQHCVFSKLKEFYTEKLKEAKSDSQKKRLETQIRKCDKLSEKYKEGITYAQLSIELVPMETTVEIWRTDQRDKMVLNAGSRWLYKFLHTRWGHVDVLLADSEPEKVGVVGMRSVMKQLLEMKKPFTFEGTPDIPRAIETADMKYRTSFPYDDLFKSFNDSIERDYFRIDYVSERKLYDYINMANRHNNHIKFQDIKNKKLKEVDCIKGYTQFKKCPWYRGFLGCVWDWCGEIDYETMKKFIGIYTIRINKVNSFIQYVGGFHQGSIVTLISPMIEMMVDKGWIECDILYGVYGSKFNFEFPKEFDAKYDEKTGILGHKVKDEKGEMKEVGIPLYSIWTGMTNHISQTRTIRHYTDINTCRTLRDAGENINWMYANECFETYTENGRIKRRLKPEVEEMNDPPGWGEQYLECDKKNNTPQIYAFITNYLRMNMLLEMEQFSYRLDDLYACKLDSIVYSGEAKFSDIMRPKEGEIKTNFSMSVRMFNRNEHNLCDLYTGELNEPIGSCLFAGAGGTGKSHRASTMRGLLYSAPMWSANVDFKKKYGVKYVMPYHQVLGIGCESFLKGAWYPATIFWDEATMLPASFRLDALKLSRHIRQIYAGDFDKFGRPYQTVLCVDRDSCLNVNGMTRVEFLEDRRCVPGDKLIDVKKEMRELMFRDYEDMPKLLDFVRSKFKRITMNEVLGIYSVDDWILCGTNVNCNEWTVKLWEKGFRKWKVTDHSRTDVFKALNGEEVYLNGDIVLKEIEKRSRPAHAFTIHSVQGKTVTSRVFIDMRSVSFNYPILYTAISRAKEYDQIYLVEG